MTFHAGNSSLKKSAKCFRTAAEPGVPGTRVCRIGARSLPVLMSKSLPGSGIALMLSSESFVYAMVNRDQQNS